MQISSNLSGAAGVTTLICHVSRYHLEEKICEGGKGEIKRRKVKGRTSKFAKVTNIKGKGYVRYAG
jgi:hypothetical protein